MRVTLEEVERIASLSMLSLDEEKKKMLQKNLDDILGHAQNVVREDVPGRVWEREDMLLNAPEKEDGFFTVPKVVD